MAAFNPQLDKQLNLQLDKKLDIPAFIYRADLQSRLQKSTSAGLMMLLWGVWIYLFIPSLTLLAWMLGYREFNQYILQNSQGFLDQISEMAKIILVLGSLFTLWAIYRRPFFKDKYLCIPPIVNLAQMAKHFELSMELILQSQRRQVNIFRFNEAGFVIDIAAPKYKEPNRLNFCGRDCCHQHDADYDYNAID